MLKVILYGLLIWFLYNLIFRFIIPIFKTTREVRQKFREMQNRMQENQAGSDDISADPQPKANRAEKVSKGDYLDFEEVR